MTAARPVGSEKRAMALEQVAQVHPSGISLGPTLN